MPSEQVSLKSVLPHTVQGHRRGRRRYLSRGGAQLQQPWPPAVIRDQTALAVTTSVNWCRGQIPTATPAPIEPSTFSAAGDIPYFLHRLC